MTAPTPEPVPETPPATAVAAPPAGAAAPLAGASRARWVAAGGVVAASVALVVGAIVLLSSRPVPEALTYVPADSAVVAELRMDLPGDQLQKVGNLLAHFPGFKDQTTLSQKLDETLARLTRDASNGSLDYAATIKPWLAGPLFAAGSAAPGATEHGDFLIVATTDGTPTCEAALAAVGNNRGASPAPLASPSSSAPVLTTLDGAFACARDGRFGLLGSTAMVQAALRAHADHKGMDANSQYRTARDRLGGDRLATIFASKAGLAAGSPLASDLPLGSAGLAALDRVPDWAMGGVSAEDDALVAELVTAPLPAAFDAAGSPLPTTPPAHKSRLAPLLPADTLALVDVHGVGVAVHNGLAQLRSDPSLAPSLTQAEGTLQALGGIDALVGWVDDAGIAVVPDGSTAAGGLVLVATDEATASAKAGQLKSLLALVALGGQAQITQTQIAGVDVTVLDIGNIGSLLQGIPGASGGTPLPVPTTQAVKIAFAAKGPAILAGGEAFVRRSLETQAGASLAEAPAYTRALGRAAVDNIGQVYVAASQVLSLAGGLMPEAGQGAFDTDVKPYLEPFDALVITTTMDRDGARVRLVATVK